MDPAPAPAVIAAIQDDLNTPQAMAEMAALVRFANTASDEKTRKKAKSNLLGSGALLGILNQEPNIWFAGGLNVDPEEIDELIVSRDMAREAKNYEKADQIRDQLISRGIVIEDGDQGTKWRIAKR